MATASEIETSIANLRGQISSMTETLAPASVALDLTGASLATLEANERLFRQLQSAGGQDFSAIESSLRGIRGSLSQVRQTTQSSTPRRPSMTKLGIGALGLAYLLTVVAIGYALNSMGAVAWQTLPGGRAVLLMALTFAFVTFGGAMLIAPIFSEGTLEERFRRSREIFLLFSGMFSTVVGFYFASAGLSGAGSSILVAESLDLQKGEIEVAVTGGKPPYLIELEFGPKESIKKKSPMTLEAPGTVKFVFAKATDWPTPILIRARDSGDGKPAEKALKPSKADLLAAEFKEPPLAAPSRP